MTSVDGRALAGLRAAGLLARDDAVASTVERFGVPGGPGPAHVVEARVAGGFAVEVLPARGFDLGAVQIDGLPVSWISPVADARPLDVPAGDAWTARFTGGLLTTCGPEHVGPVTAEHGLHGSASHRPGRVVRADAGVRQDGGWFVVEGVVDHASVFGPSLRLRRTITGDLDEAGRPRSTSRTAGRTRVPSRRPSICCCI